MSSTSVDSNHPDNHYENFPVASFLCPKHIRPAVVAIYRFARTADDIADEGDKTAQQRLYDLQTYRTALDAACQAAPITSQTPWHDVMQPLQQAIAQYQLPTQCLHDLITAFEQDTRHTQAGHVYHNWHDLHDYAKYSANPVGRLMLHLYNVHDAASIAQSDAICTALQFYNFWQDISVDVARKRYYLPSEICTQLHIDPCCPHTAPSQQRTQLLTQLLDYTDSLMLSGANLPKRVAQYATQGAWLASVELQLVIQGGWHIGQKTRKLGAQACVKRPVLRSFDWIHIIMSALRYRFFSS